MPNENDNDVMRNVMQVEPAYLARQASMVKAIEAYVEGDKLVQVFEYIDGPKKGERLKLVTSAMAFKVP